MNPEEVEDVKGSETDLMGTILPGQSKTNSNPSQELRPRSTDDQNLNVASKVQSVISEDEGATRIISQMSHTNLN